MKKICFVATLLAAFVLCHSAKADFVVDNSPDAVGGPFNTNFFNSFLSDGGGSQTVGDSFVLSDTFIITGGAFYGLEGGVDGSFAGVGEEVEFAIFADAGGLPAATPLFSEVTTVDAYDNVGNLRDNAPGAFRYHATLSTPVTLGPGTYYFTLPGVNDDPTVAAGFYAGGDDTLFAGFDGNIDLEGGAFTALGDAYFQLEGTRAIPEPATASLLAFGLVGFVARRRR